MYCTESRRIPAGSALSLTHNSSQDFSGTGSAGFQEGRRKGPTLPPEQRAVLADETEGDARRDVH
jgi:hypothetical protein